MNKKKKIQEIAEELDRNVSWENGYVRFQRFSSTGQDFNCEIGFKNVGDIVKNLYEWWNNFDISYEAYLWLDHNGHGTNGAPYEMIDVYNDMKECYDAVEDLFIELRKGVGV